MNLETKVENEIFVSRMKTHLTIGKFMKPIFGSLNLYSIVNINKLTSVFHASVLLLIMNFVLTLSN